MECEQVKKEFPDIHFPPCCDSCHDDEGEGFGEDLWFEIDGEDRHVCCSIINAIETHDKKLNE